MPQPSDEAQPKDADLFEVVDVVDTADLMQPTGIEQMAGKAGTGDPVWSHDDLEGASIAQTWDLGNPD
jgi:hypothetical protein